MDAALAGDVDLALRWADLCKLVVATVAPEIEDGLAVVGEAFGRGMAGFTLYLMPCRGR